MRSRSLPNLHKLELTLTDLAGKHTALRHDHDAMQGELSREFDSVTTAQGEQFALLREIQKDIGGEQEQRWPRLPPRW